MSKNQITGNIGLYYVCYELSRLGWNVLTTSRNAEGVDIVVYDQSGKRTNTIQVKSLSKRKAASISTPNSLIAKYLVIVRSVQKPNPELFVAEINDELKGKVTNSVGKNGEKQYWIEYRTYEQFSKNLDVIGKGASE